MIGALSNWASDKLPPTLLARAYSRTPASLTRAMTESAFRKTVRYAAKHSKYYREKFAEHGIDAARVRVPSDLGDFYTTPEDLVARPDDFLCAPPGIVFESSGTSGKNKRVYYSESEMQTIGRSLASGFEMMGVAPTDRVANGFDFSIWIPGLTMHYGLMRRGCFCLAFGKVDPVEVYRRLDLHRFNVILGEPTWLIRLTELAEKDGGRPLKLLIGAAEEMPAKAIPWMRDVWKGAKVKMCYGSVEQGSGLGFQPCDHADGYHINVLDHLTEVVDVEDGWGEIVFTTLRRHVMPLIRYRTRDISRMEASCPCGIKAPRIARIRGRRDELVVASGGNLYPLMFENILKEIPGLTHDWQVEFTLENVREIVTVHVETPRTDTPRLREEVIHQATLQYPDLIKNLNLGIFELRVNPMQPGTVRSARKLKRLVDKRHFGA